MASPEQPAVRAPQEVHVFPVLCCFRQLVHKHEWRSLGTEHTVPSLTLPQSIRDPKQDTSYLHSGLTDLSSPAGPEAHFESALGPGRDTTTG